MADLDSLCGRVLGEFVLRERIDEGGFGSVYRCDQPLLGRAAVVKVLHQRLRQRDVVVRRFLREARLASRLDHPYAAHVYAFGIEHEDGLAWIAMELVAGVTLTQWLRDRGPMPLEALVPFFERVAEVVHAAHERGIVHRDLKPSNIMVVERAGQLLPKLLDFGVAKILNEVGFPCVPETSDDSWSMDPERTPPMRRAAAHAGASRLTRASAAIGSPPYMAPEQWDDPLSVGPASDLYALGTIAYEALTGRRPFMAETTEQYGALHRRALVPPLGAGFAPGLDRLFRRALAKRPEDRCGSALELSAALRAELEGRRKSRLVAAARRWRRAVIAVAAAGALAGIQYRGYVRAQADARVAEERLVTADVEQGRQALLHGESAEALAHLSAAYRRGSSDLAVEFMLARSLEPRLVELARLPATSGRLWSAAWAPDGARIATADDRAVRLWDASGRLLATLEVGASAVAVAYSVDRIVVAVADGTVHIWDPNGAAQRTLRAPSAPQYYALAVSSDGRFVAAIDIAGGVAQVWDARTGALLAELANDGEQFPSIAFSPDGHWLATGGGDDARVFDTATWTQALTIHGPRIRCLAFDPTRPRIATGTAGGDASIWEIPTGRRIAHLREVGEPIDAIAFDRRGKLLATAARDGAEQVWRAASGELVVQVNQHHGKILAAEFSPDGSQLLAAGSDGTVAIADLEQGTPVTVLTGPSSVVREAHWDPAGHRIVGASWDGAARVWDARAPYQRFRSSPIAEDCGVAAGLEPDRRFVAIGCYDGPTRVWDTAREQLLAELPGVAEPAPGFELPLPAVSSDGHFAAIARGTTAEVYALPGGGPSRVATAAAAVSAIAFAPSGDDMVVGDVEGSVVLARAAREPLVLPGLGAGVDAVALAADGRVIVAAGTHMRSYANGAVAADLDLGARTRSLRIEGDRLLAIPNKERAVAPVLVDLGEGRIVARLEGHVGQVYGARFVAGGRILTAGGDGTARLWDSATGRQIQAFRGGSRFLADAALDPTAAIAVAGGADGLLRFWDVATGQPLWTLQAHRSHVVGIHYEGDDIVTRGFDGSIARWSVQKLQSVTEACSVDDAPRAMLEACSMLAR